MAQEMNVSRSTVKCYVAKVIEKTGVSSRHDLALDKPRPRLEPLRRRA
jgi:DNA-binding NarL/FixJ family response regulator